PPWPIARSSREPCPTHPVIAESAKRHAAMAFQVALAWVLRQPDRIAIPKAASPDHVAENAGAADLVPTADDLSAIDAALPPPTRKTRLEML
ncbi:MAG: aldo/keto reductase, partial [Caulobacteraceae bacterium]|nr:aldo/keto reductase [Caulobacteraceae bacterium]